MAINDPRDIPGLLVWYSAEYEAANYTDGQEMTSWTDLSGVGNHATAGTTSTAKPFWQATSGPNAGPSVRFGVGSGGTGATGAYFALPSGIFAGLTAAEVMGSVRAEFDNTTQNGNWIKAGSQTGQSHYPYQTTIYDDFGSTARKTVGSVAGLSQWHRPNVWSAANDYGYYFDGVSKYATAINTVGWATMPRLGNSGPPGATSNQTVDTWEGYLGAVVLYSRKLTATERADLDAWLAAHPNGGTTGPLTPAATLNGTTPAVTGAFDLATTEPPPAITLAGTAPAVTGAFDASVAVPPISADLAGNAPKVTGSFTLEQTGVGTVDLAGTAPGVFGSFDVTASGAPIEVATAAVNRLNGMTLVTEWQVEVNPPVTEPKRQRAHDYAVAVSITEPTLVEGRPT